MKNIFLTLLLLTFASCTGGVKYNKKDLANLEFPAKYRISNVTFNIDENISGDFAKYPDSKELSKIFSKSMKKKLEEREIIAKKNEKGLSLDLVINFFNYERIKSIFKSDAFAFFIESSKMSIENNGNEIAHLSCKRCKLSGYITIHKHALRSIVPTGNRENEIEDLDQLAAIMADQLVKFNEKNSK